MPDHYQILGISPGAGEQAIKDAYRRRVRRVHPDTETGETEMFLAVQQAYEVLSARQKRLKYNPKIKSDVQTSQPRQECRKARRPDYSIRFPDILDRVAIGILALIFFTVALKL